MKKIISAAVAIFGFNVAMAQTVNTQVKVNNERKAVNKPVQATPEMRAERSSGRMKSELTLSEDQYTKVLALKKEKYKAISEVNDKYPGKENRDARVAALKPIVESYKASLSEILTPEQLKKHQENVAMRHERAKTTAARQNNPNAPDNEELLMKNETE